MTDNMLAIIDRFDPFVIHQQRISSNNNKKDIVNVVDTCSWLNFNVIACSISVCF